MKRHPALVPLSHDHHHGLVEARRLRRAAEADAAGRREAAQAFGRFFARETRRHFQEEEEALFPLLARPGAEPPALLLQALAEHALIRRLVRELTAAREPEAGLLTAIGETLERHIRLEERELFPLVEQTVTEAELEALALDEGAGPGRAEEAEQVLVDLDEGAGEGPLWGTATEDLNATLLAWPAGGGVPEHVNHERDVLLVVLAGGGTLVDEGKQHELRPGRAVVVRKGRSRSLAAGPDGLRYLSVHLRRPGLEIRPRAAGP